MEWMIIFIVVVGIPTAFLIGFCIRQRNNRQNEREEVLIINENRNQELNVSQNNLVVAQPESQINLEISQINFQIKATDKKKKRIKPIRLRKRYIRQLKLIRTKKLKLCRTLKNFNKQKEKQIYLGEKQKKINLENKKIIQDQKKLAIEENKALDNIMHTISIINLKMNFNGGTKAFLDPNSPKTDMSNNGIKNKNDEI